MTVILTSTLQNTDKRDLIVTHIIYNFPYRKAANVSWFFGCNIRQTIWFRSTLCFFSCIVNSVLARLCQYGNQTFSANQSIITPNCTERCQCHQISGTECKPLCLFQEDPKCHPHSERIKEFERSLNNTNCICTEKRCVSGINTLHYYLCLKLDRHLKSNNIFLSLAQSEGHQLQAEFYANWSN